MEFTGERVIPGQVDPDLWNEHLARYAFAARWSANARNLRVLDAGCGSGYGAAHLACLDPAVQVVGLDNSEEALAYARQHYASPNLRFELGDCLVLPFGAGQFDLVVALEVIEHLAEPATFLTQVRRVLSASGRLLVSTPNRRYYSEERAYTNPFHTREYDLAEFDALLQPFFAERVVFVQNHVVGQAFLPVRNAGQHACATLGATPAADDEPHFLLAVASRAKLPPAEPFVFVPSAGNLLREREQHIRKIEQDHAAFQESARRELEERRRWAEQQVAELAARDQTIRRLQSEHEGAIAWARDLDARLQEAAGVIAALQRELDERTAWAQQLDAERERLAGMVKNRQEELEGKVTWARSLEADVEKAREALANLQREFDGRTAWALQLDAERVQLQAALAERAAELEAVRVELRQIFGSLWYRLGKRLRLSPVPPSDRGRGSGP